MIKNIVLNMVVYNEGHRIYHTLNCLKESVDSMIIVDQQSTDNTIDEINRFKETYPDIIILSDHHWGYCEPSRKKAWKSTPPNSWILVMDADEELSNEFKIMMRHVDPDVFDGVRMNRALYLSGEFRFEKDYQFRFFKHGKVSFVNDIHTEPRAMSTRILQVDFIAIKHNKTWVETIRDELSYEARINAMDKNQHFKKNLNVHLHWLKKTGLTAEQVDAMSIEDRVKAGLSDPSVYSDPRKFING